MIDRYDDNSVALPLNARNDPTKRKRTAWFSRTFAHGAGTSAGLNEEALCGDLIGSDAGEWIQRKRETKMLHG